MIEVTGLFLYSLFGILAGIIIGLVPGLGISSTFLLLSPLLISVSPVYSLFMFVSMLVTSQYFGSVTALVFGIPGEISSYPIINERPNLTGQLNNLLKQTAFGSLFASLFALGVFSFLMQTGNLWVYLYNYKIFAWVLAFAVLATIMFGSKSNGIVTNAVIFIAGYLLAKIGFSKDMGQSWGTFGITELSAGIPIAAVSLGLLIIPSLISITTQNYQPTLEQNLIKSITHWGSIIRGSVLGIIGGLVPGVTYMASTQLSYFVENKINSAHHSRPARAVIATSSADNAGSVSSLYPLLWLGIPISLGEAVLIWLFEKQNTNLNWSTLNQSIDHRPLYWYLAACFIIANLIAYMLSWPGRRLSISLARAMLSTWSKYVMLVVVSLSVVFLATEHYNPMIFYGSFAIACCFGISLKQIDWMPLIMGFILQDSLELTLLKIGIINI